MILELPQMLQMPEKLYPILTEINDYRYFMLEGGRGGGKSQAIGRLILYLCEKKHIRVACGREIQNSIIESVYSLLSDLIRKNNLNFEVMASKIVHRKTGSTINFRGFREQGAFNIQGMEGIDIVWIDEAQAITKQTLDVLIPTIRKERAKIFFSMNRHIEKDPVYFKFFDRKDCKHININYDDNPYCTEALKVEAIECRKKSEADYMHIWMGEPLLKTEDAVFVRKDIYESNKDPYKLRDGYGFRISGYDIARYGDDKCAAVIIQQQGALHWKVILADQWDHRDLNYTTGRVLLTSQEHQVNKSIIDENGIGAGPLDTLNKGRGLDEFTGFKNPPIAYAKNKYYANERTANAYKLKDMIDKQHIEIPYDEIIEELLEMKYEFDNYQRKRLIPKDKMRKEGIKSPNLADALLMSVSLIGNVAEVQQRDRARQPQYSSDDNLFNIMGVR